MKEINQQVLTGERALYQAHDLHISNATFTAGESPLKEARDLAIEHTNFKYKYPLWYDQNVTITDSIFETDAHAGIWYTDHLKMSNTLLNTGKTFRRATDIELDHVTMPIAAETLWNCDQVTMTDVTVTGNYFGMNSTNIYAKNLQITGDYAFDGAKNVEIHDSVLFTKDAFWNCENVTVYNSTISGEYLAWNTKNITFIDCTIKSEQGLCYIDHLTMKNCQLINTSLAFELCADIDAEITTAVDSIKNPISGTIKAKQVNEIIFDNDTVDRHDTVIIETGVIAHASGFLGTN